MLQNFKKFFIVLFLLIALSLLLVTVGLNSYLIFSGVKEKSAERIQEALGKKLQIGWVYFLPWSGFYVKSITLVDSIHSYSLRASSITFGIVSILNICKNNQDWVGELRIKKIVLNERPVFKKIVIEMCQKNGTFSLNPFTAKCFYGTFQGDFLLEKNKEDLYHYEGNCSFSNIPLQELLSGTPFQKRVSSGFLQGTTRFSGIVEDPQSLHGLGTLQLVNTELKTADFFGPLSRFFSLEELQLLKLREAKANYTFSSDSLRIDSARLQSNNMLLTTHGTISFQGKVGLEAELVLSGKCATYIKNVLPQDLLSMVNQKGYCTIPFRIFGSLSNLKSNFSEKILIPQIPNNIGGALQQLLNNSINLK